MDPTAPPSPLWGSPASSAIATIDTSAPSLAAACLPAWIKESKQKLRPGKAENQRIQPPCLQGSSQDSGSKQARTFHPILPEGIC